MRPPLLLPVFGLTWKSKRCCKTFPQSEPTARPVKTPHPQHLISGSAIIRLNFKDLPRHNHCKGSENLLVGTPLTVSRKQHQLVEGSALDTISGEPN